MPTFITLPTPIQEIRQFAEAPFVDMVFNTTAERIAYLTSPRRYGGMIVTDKEEQLIYFLNTARDTWLSIASGTAPALGLGSKEFTITLDGSTGGGEIGALTLPPIDVPMGAFIAGAFIDVSDDGLTADDDTAYITLGIEGDDEVAILDDILGLVTQLNTNIVTKVTTSLTKASIDRLLVAAVNGANITAGVFKVIVVISEQLVNNGGDCDCEGSLNETILFTDIDTYTLDWDVIRKANFGDSGNFYVEIVGDDDIARNTFVEIIPDDITNTTSYTFNFGGTQSGRITIS